MKKQKRSLTMKAAIYMGKENVEIRELPKPVCGEDDVLIQNIYSSICGTDVAVYKHGPNTGHRITVGGEFGHETVSRVAAVGKNVTGFTVGERVYPYPLLAKNDTKRAGTIGLAAAVALQYFGVRNVMVCDLSDYRLKIAKELGFTVCNTQKENLKEKAEAYFGTAHGLSGTTMNVDIFLDAAGDESILETFMDQGKIVSRFVSVAVNNKLRSLDLLHLTYAQKSIIGSGDYFPEDVRDVMKIMESGRWDLEKMITHEFPLDEINQAIQTASDTEHAFNVIIHF